MLDTMLDIQDKKQCQFLKILLKLFIKSFVEGKKC